MANVNLRAIITAEDNASSALKKVSSNVGGLEKSVSDLERKLVTGLKVATVGAIGALTGLAVSSIKTAANFQQFRVSFESMLGSADKAKSLLKSITLFAKETPFELNQVVEGSKRLIAYNVAAEKVIPTFKILGDIAAGVGTDKLPQLITAFGQVSAKGRLMGQELLQFTEAGVNLGGELSKSFGVTRTELEKMVSEGKIGFADVERALQNMTSEGNLFHDGMINQSRTLNGMISNLKDGFTLLLLSIAGVTTEGEIIKGGFFDKVNEAAKQLIVWVNANQEKLQEWGSKIGEFIVGSGQKLIDIVTTTTRFFREHADTITNFVVPALTLLISTMLALKVAMAIQAIITGVSAAISALGAASALAAGPIGLVGAAVLVTTGLVIGAVKAWYDYRDAVNAARRSADDLNATNQRALAMADRLQAQGNIAGASSLRATVGRNQPGRAVGGPVMAGKPYTVGEHGPETFVPSQSGRVVPNAQAGAMSININMNGPMQIANDADMGRLAEIIGQQIRLTRQGAQ